MCPVKAPARCSTTRRGRLLRRFSSSPSPVAGAEHGSPRVLAQGPKRCSDLVLCATERRTEAIIHLCRYDVTSITDVFGVRSHVGQLPPRPRRTIMGAVVVENRSCRSRRVQRWDGVPCPRCGARPWLSFTPDAPRSGVGSAHLNAPQQASGTERKRRVTARAARFDPRKHRRCTDQGADWRGRCAAGCQRTSSPSPLGRDCRSLARTP